MTSMNEKNTRPMGLPGAVLDGRFRIDKFIGSGGMGAVYRGTQLNVNRPVAIKLLHSEDVSGVRQLRFEREARIMATFAHPNIVQFHDLGRTPDGLVYIVMEFVDGGALSKILQKGRLSVDLAVELATQLFSALSEAHAHGVVHRDIKPENMLIAASTQGEVRLKVLDFGLAHGAEDVRLTQAGRVSGTPYYIAPEMARDEGVSARSDLYSAGVVFFEMLTGHPPFSGASMQVMFKHVNEEPPRLDPMRFPAPLVDLVATLLAKDPNGRPTSADAVLDVLRPLRPTRRLMHANLAQELLPALSLEPSRPLIQLNQQRSGAVPGAAPSRTTTPLLAPQPEPKPEPRGAWDAFRSVAEAAPEPEPILDPNLDGSFEFEGGIGASDVSLRPVPVQLTSGADVSTEVDQLTHIQIPAGARVMATDQLQAVQGPAPADESKLDAPVPLKQARLDDLRPMKSSPTPPKPTPPGQAAAATAQVHDGTAARTRHRSQTISPLVWVVLLIVFGAVGYALHLKFKGLDPRDPRTTEEREAEWLRIQKQAEQRGARRTAPAVGSDPAAKKRQKKSAEQDEVIDLFDDQGKMAPEKVIIERRQ